MKRWNDGHKHFFRYFGGMASCIECAATVSPDGKVSAPTKRSRQHQQMAAIAQRKRK